MFASVNSHDQYTRSLKPSGRHESQRVDQNFVCSLPENFAPKVSRSLITRRIKNLTVILHLSLLRRDIERAQRAFSILLRCERHGVNLRTLWELGLEVLLRSSGTSKVKAEEFLGRVRLTSSDIGHHPTAEKQVCVLVVAFNAFRWFHYFPPFLS